jgi:septal ring factor EnvC (AmiA/AmiB activator)
LRKWLITAASILGVTSLLAIVGIYTSARDAASETARTEALRTIKDSSSQLADLILQTQKKVADIIAQSGGVQTQTEELRQQTGDLKAKLISLQKQYEGAKEVIDNFQARMLTNP